MQDIYGSKKRNIINNNLTNNLLVENKSIETIMFSLNVNVKVHINKLITLTKEDVFDCWTVSTRLVVQETPQHQTW